MNFLIIQNGYCEAKTSCGGYDMDLSDVWKKRCITQIIIAIVLVTILVFFCWFFEDSSTAQLAPDEGKWCCPEIGLTIFFGTGGKALLSTPDSEMQCFVMSHKQSPVLNVFTTIRDSYDGILYPDEKIYSFNIVELSENYFVVTDSQGQNYIFSRDTGDKGGQRGQA